jgi:hypothetical protein
MPSRGPLERSGGGPSTPKHFRGQNPAFGGRALFAAALLEPVVVAAHLQDLDMVGKQADQWAAQPLRAKNLGPLVARTVRCHRQWPR